ncbi:hypothetical protein RB195_011606 [Necator americanus]|uniref:Uncharacterized protein n=1 Tax=Necator americanus TaxID=51031 RepID=A0ABR1D3A3_NECAM
MPFQRFPCKVRNAIMPLRNRTKPGPDRIRSELLKNLPPVLIKTLARLVTSEFKAPNQWKTSKTVLVYKKGDDTTLATISQSAYYRSFRSSLQK